MVSHFACSLFDAMILFVYLEWCRYTRRHSRCFENFVIVTLIGSLRFPTLKFLHTDIPFLAVPLDPSGVSFGVLEMGSYQQSRHGDRCMTPRYVYISIYDLLPLLYPRHDDSKPFKLEYLRVHLTDSVLYTYLSIH